MEIGYTPSNLKRLREAAGMTQQQLADRLNVNRITVASWENGKHGVSHEFWLSILKELPSETLSEPEAGYTPSNLKLLRKRHGLTQQEVADAAGVSGQHLVSAWEQDETSPSHKSMTHERWIALLKKFSFTNNKKKGNKMKIKVIKLEGRRRVVVGKYADIIDIDYTQPLDEIQQDLELIIPDLLNNLSLIDNISVSGNIIIYRGNNHIRICLDGSTRDLNWLSIGDHLF